MTKKIERISERFELENASGARFHGIHHQTYLVIEPLDGSRSEIKGLGRYTLANGHDLNLNDDGSFTDIRPNQTLTRV